MFAMVATAGSENTAGNPTPPPHPAAGNGYNGLPPAFTERNLKATTVIVADPNVVSALATGGYAATEYLNSAFVDAVASQFH
jgi:serine/threonine-protein kinase